MPKVGDRRVATCLFCKEQTDQVLKHSWAEWGNWECTKCGQNPQTNVLLDEAPPAKG